MTSPDSTTSVEGVDARMREAGENRLRILLVDEHLLLRQSLRALLDTDPALEVVGEARTVTEALKAVDRLKPGLALTDLGLPDGTGINLASELRARGSLTRIFILSAHAMPEHVKAALDAGVLGYALKDVSYAELVKGLHAVIAGQMFLCVRGSDESIKAGILLRSAQERRLSITDREREVLTCIAHGYTNKDIARLLERSVKTIEKHRSNMMHKLDLHSAAAVTVFAFNNGLAL